MTDKKRDGVTPLIVLAVLVLLVMIFSMMLYQQPWLIIALSSVTYLIVATLFFIVFTLPKKGKKALSETQQQQLKALKDLFAQLVLKTKKPQPYHIPWYIQLHRTQDNIATQLKAMGFEAHQQNEVMGVSFWLSDKAVFVSVNQDNSDLETSLALLAKLLLNYRARQPLNGVLVNISVLSLLSDHSAELMAIADQQKSLTTQINRLFKQKLPTYASITELYHLRDFCESFALTQTLDNQPLSDEQPLFGYLTDQEDGQSFDENWFEHSFDTLFSQLYHHHKHQLQSEVQTNNIKVIAGAPLQFYELKASLKKYLGQLFHPVQEKDRFNFRGYFFSSAGQSEQQLDQLSFHVANRLGYNSIPITANQCDKPALFARQLFPSLLAQESPLVGTRKTANRNYFIKKWLGYSVILSVFSLIGAFFIHNYQFYDSRDNQALMMLKTVEAAAMDDAMGANDAALFAQMTDNLWQLRSIAELYQTPLPDYISALYPAKEVKMALINSYHALNGKYLLNFVHQALEKQIAVSLDDADTAGETYMQLHHKYKLLFVSPRQVDQDLVAYYAKLLPLDSETTIPVSLLLQDALAQPYVPEQPNEPLLAQLEKHLIGKDFPRYIYKTLLAQAPYNQTVDLKPALGKKLFTFSTIGPKQLLMPYAFTKDGFAALLQTIEAGHVDRLIDTYSHVLTSHELTSVKRRVYGYISDYYVDDYISHWAAFEQQTYPLSRLSDSDISPLLTELSAKQSALDNYYSLILYHTSLTEPPQADSTAANQDSITQSVRGRNARLASAMLAQLPEQDQAVKRHQAMAQNITEAFKNHRQWQQSNDSKQHYNQVIEWLATTQNPQVLFNAVKEHKGFPLFKPQGNTPLFVSRINQQIEKTVNSINMRDVLAYVNERWQQEVLSQYRHKLKDKFPFEHLSQQDAALTDFSEFFKAGGTVERFSKAYLDKVQINASGLYYFPDFLGSEQWQLTPIFGQFIAQTKTIQSVFFNQNQLSIDLFLKVQQMSPQLLSLEVEQQQNILAYQHGPKLTHQIRWPYQGSADEPLVFITQDINGNSKTQFTGNWSWFRLAYQDYFNKAAPNKVSHFQLIIGLLDDRVKLAIETSSKIAAHPLNPELFLSYKVPVRL